MTELTNEPPQDGDQAAEQEPNTPKRRPWFTSTPEGEICNLFNRMGEHLLEETLPRLLKKDEQS